MLIFLVGLIFLLLGVLMGGALCVSYLRREIADDIGPKLKRVNGHWEIRLGGLVFSGLAATSFPGWWPRVLPAGGG